MRNYHIDYEDVQGLAIRGYGRLPFAAYVFIAISEQKKFRAWLHQCLLNEDLTPATVRKPENNVCSSLAFTMQGLVKLAGDAIDINSFPDEFIEGMVNKQRSRLLGDTGSNDPEHWRWGAEGSIDAMVFLCAATEAELMQAVREIDEENGMQVVYLQKATIPEDGKEPFGFDDGISQPILKGTDREDTIKARANREYDLHVVEAGEFLLGYPDGTGKLPRTPSISSGKDRYGLLRSHPVQPELRDFGRNGSYIVIRQLAQDVNAFDEYVKSQRNSGMDVAAKMVGRTRDGKTLATDSLQRDEFDNDFDYIQDSAGHGCPIGSHVRRTNPRSALHADSREGALKVSNRHRIIRRGRVYQNQDGETGLFFLCFNASINRQFEFIQSTWCNDPFFQGLAAEVDPLIGTQSKGDGHFNAPAQPFRCKFKDVPEFVKMVGGVYLFLPGLSALKALL